jgi:serine/threonine-protein kinase
MMLGTPNYMAPEQVTGGRTSPATDIFAFGAVLYELLTGEPSRRAGSLSELGADDGFRAPDLDERLPEAPGGLVAAVTACLSIRPEDRPPSAAALARLLAPVGSEAETVPLPADPGQRATEILSLPPRRWTARRSAAVAAVVAAGVAGLVAAVALSRGHKSPRPSSTPRAVSPPPTGRNPAQQAQNLATWLRNHAG